MTIKVPDCFDLYDPDAAVLRGCSHCELQYQCRELTLAYDRKGTAMRRRIANALELTVVLFAALGLLTLLLNLW